MGGRRHGQTQNQAELPSPSVSASRFGSLQIGGAQQPQLTRLATRVRIRHRPIHRLVLLRASFGLKGEGRVQSEQLNRLWGLGIRFACMGCEKRGTGPEGFQQHI